jgi:pyruvate formate lyase activating enzyme
VIFGGIRKTSLIDYPGKVSCVVFALGCNFRCPYCHNPDLVRGKPAGGRLEEKEVYAFLKHRKGLLDGVVLSGGDPTLQEDLIHVCRHIKELGFSVKLDTNGGRPHVLKAILSAECVDYVAMDIKTDPYCYAPAVGNAGKAPGILESIHTVMESSVAYEFRTTCVRPFVDEAIMERIASAIEGAKRYVLQYFRFENLLDPDFYGQSSPGFDTAGMTRLMAVAAPRVESCIIR